MVNTCGAVAMYTLETLAKARDTDAVCTIGPMVTSMMVNGWKANDMAQVVLHTRTVVVMRASFQNGKKEGKGVEVKADGARYEGEFVDGSFGGAGKYTWPNGNTFEGECKRL